MLKTPYPGYDVLDKWQSVSFDAPTRSVLGRRLHDLPGRRFFTETEWNLLGAIAARLLPQPDRKPPIAIVPWIDEALAAGRGEGFRHDDMPPLALAWHAALKAIDAEARRRHARGFVELDAAARDGVLRAVQAGEVDAALWDGVPAQRFFTEVLLKTVVGVYYAHPAAWSEIGFGGPASPRGYVRLGLNERDPWEAREAREAREEP